MSCKLVHAYSPGPATENAQGLSDHKKLSAMPMLQDKSYTQHFLKGHSVVPGIIRATIMPSLLMDRHIQ